MRGAVLPLLTLPSAEPSWKWDACSLESLALDWSTALKREPLYPTRPVALRQVDLHQQ